MEVIGRKRELAGMRSRVMKLPLVLKRCHAQPKPLLEPIFDVADRAFAQPDARGPTVQD